MRHSHAPEVLHTSLYVAMFIALDTFITSLVSALFEVKPQLFGAIDRSLSLEDMMRHGSLDAVKKSLLQDEIDALRRKSYVEQFEYMERVFGLSLRQFDDWPAFVEAGQRRNLYVHCDGIVSEQYLEICRKNKVPVPSNIVVGHRYFMDIMHTFDTVRVMARLGVTLAHTLWRKVLPDELDLAEKHLHLICYDALQRGRLKFAVSIARFALSPMISKGSTDIARKINTITLLSD